jgi:hypothetical protein
MTLEERRPPTRRRRAMAWGTVSASLIGGLVVGIPSGKAGAASSHGAAQIATARKSLLVLSDMPQDWTSTKSSNDNSPIPGSAGMAHCLGVPVSRINDNPPTANSREFDSKDGLLSVDDSVSVFPSAAAARADIGTVQKKNATHCLSANFNGPSKAVLEKGFGAGTTVGTIEVTRNPTTYYAPHTTNFTLFLPVTHQGETINLTISEVVFVKGQEEQTVSLTSVQSQFPTSLSHRLTTLADSRL